MPIVLLVVVLLIAATPALGQELPRRPELARTADPNDWEAYFDWAVDRVRERSSRAYDGFYWASRLEPSRAEPLIGLWVGFWLRERDRWPRYLQGERSVMEAPDVLIARNARYKALLRNPLAHQGLIVVLYDMLPGRWRDDVATRAMLAYAETDLPRSAELYRRAIERNPTRNNELRYRRALAFTSMNRLDSALVELQTMLAVLRARDESQVVEFYDSKEMIEYAIGRVQLELNQFDAARASFEQALIEDASFHAAHLMLGALAMRRRQSQTAVTEMQRAVELAPEDAWVRSRYATALLQARRFEEAAAEYQMVVEKEPWWAEAWFLLASSLDRAERAVEAAEAYSRYLAVAPRKNVAEQHRARERISLLQAKGN